MRHAFAPTRWGFLLSLVAALSCLSASTVLAADTWDTPDAKWRSGPAKLILTREEDQAYRKLKTDEERAKFVEEFWSRRDPSPGTPDNEYRDAFYRLAREAASRFSEEGGKGWQDDRGKVFILLGPPDDTKEGTSLLDSESPSSGGIDSPSRAPGGAMGGEERPRAPTRTIKFIYFKDPLSGRNEHMELDFKSDPTGGYRLEQKLPWDHPFLKGLVHRPPPTVQAPAPKVPAVPETPAAPIPPPVEATPQSDLMGMIRSTADAQTTVPLDVTVNFYKASKGTLATLTLEVKKSALPLGTDPAALIVSAEILDLQTGESTHRFFKADSFGGYEDNTATTAGDVLLFQAERPILPGKYRAIFAVKDPASGALGKLEKEIEVPSFESADLAMSSVTLARKAEPLATAPPVDKLIPFVLGAFNVVPRPDNVFKEGEELSFYFQIYGPAMNPVTNVAKVDLSYTFEKDVAGQWRVVGGRPVLTPGQARLVQAYSLPLRGWPPGDYRLTIKVTDTLATPPKMVASVTPFVVAGAPAPSKAKAKSKG